MLREEKTENPEKKPSWHGRKQHIKQTQFTYDLMSEPDCNHGKKSVHSPLGQSCHPPTRYSVMTAKILFFNKNMYISGYFLGNVHHILYIVIKCRVQYVLYSVQFVVCSM